MRNKFDALNEIQGGEHKEYTFNYKLAFWILLVSVLVKWVSLSIFINII